MTVIAHWDSHCRFMDSRWRRASFRLLHAKFAKLSDQCRRDTPTRSHRGSGSAARARAARRRACAGTSSARIKKPARALSPRRSSRRPLHRPRAHRRRRAAAAPKCRRDLRRCRVRKHLVRIRMRTRTTRTRPSRRQRHRRSLSGSASRRGHRGRGVGECSSDGRCHHPTPGKISGLPP